VSPLIKPLSAERFATYKRWAGADEPLAERLYTYNVTLSAALYGPLHMLEVTLRNAIDERLIITGGINWLDDQGVLRTDYQQGCVNSARAGLRRERKAATHPQLVAELGFGFWSSLFGRESQHLWGHLRPIFQAGGLQRKIIAGELRELRILRNRVAHYEPILSLPLAARYASLIALTGWLSADAEAWIRQHSTWPTLFPAVPILIEDPETGALRFNPAALPILSG
jgi:hypothetical protein